MKTAQWTAGLSCSSRRTSCTATLLTALTFLSLTLEILATTSPEGNTTSTKSHAVTGSCTAGMNHMTMAGNNKNNEHNKRQKGSIATHPSPIKELHFLPGEDFHIFNNKDFTHLCPQVSARNGTFEEHASLIACVNTTSIYHHAQ